MRRNMGIKTILGKNFCCEDFSPKSENFWPHIIALTENITWTIAFGFFWLVSIIFQFLEQPGWFLEKWRINVKIYAFFLYWALK